MPKTPSTKSRPSEPWLSLFNDLDLRLTEKVQLHCCGGFVVTEVYGVVRPTSDMDFLQVVPHSFWSSIESLVGEGSALSKKYKVHLHSVTVATYPESYADRLIEIFPGAWNHIQLFALEAHDLALTKLERNFERDLEDVEQVALDEYLQPEVLRARYFEEFRPNLTSREVECDRKLQEWCDLFWPG